MKDQAMPNYSIQIPLPPGMTEPPLYHTVLYSTIKKLQGLERDCSGKIPSPLFSLLDCFISCLSFAHELTDGSDICGTPTGRNEAHLGKRDDHSKKTVPRELCAFDTVIPSFPAQLLSEYSSTVPIRQHAPYFKNSMID